MKWFRFLILFFIASSILVTVAIQMEKATVDLMEMRPDRLPTHFRKVAFAPGSRTAWAAGFNGTIVRTDNAGETWVRQITDTTARLYGLHVSDIQTLHACGSDGTLIHSSNGGKTWRKMHVPTRYRLVDVFFINPKTGWVVGDNGCILKTDNGGSSWKSVNTGISSGFRRIWFKDNTHGFISGYEGILLKTDNGGDTWIRAKLPEHVSFYGIHFDPDGRDCLIVGSCGIMAQSKDNGQTWNMLPVVTTNFLRDIDVHPSGFGCAAGYEVILTRETGSDTWKKTGVFPGIHLQSIALGPDGVGIAAGHWGALIRTTDYGKTWSLQVPWFAPDLQDIAINDVTGNIVAVGADGLSLIQQPGQSCWRVKHTGSRETLKSVAVDQSGRAWCLGGNPGNIFILPQEQDWHRKSLGIGIGHSLNHIMFYSASNGVISGDHGTLLMTSDAGETWTEMPNPTQKNIHAVHFLDENTGYLFGDDGLIMETFDSGSSWLGHVSGTTSGFVDGWFGFNGHSLLISPYGVLESRSNGHNSSWFESGFNSTVTAVAPGCRYVGMLNGDILDRRSGVSRCLSNDPIRSFAANRKGTQIWGAGRFGRITRIMTNEINLLLSNDHQK